MEQYHDLLRKILIDGVSKEDRTGTGTWSIFGYQLRFDLREGFPLLTTKKLHIPSIVHELLWFIAGNTNIKYLQENKVRIWDEWADGDGELGPVYGKQWRSWKSYEFKDRLFTEQTHDQLKNVIERIKTNPDCRRLIVSAWNVGELNQMALMPCHVMFQFYVANGKLSCHMYQRSADTFLGVPFNIASYALLTHMIAQVCGLGVGDLVISFGDAHIYKNHYDQVSELMSRARIAPELPTLNLNPNIMDIDKFTFDDIQFLGYNPLPAIKAPVAI